MSFSFTVDESNRSRIMVSNEPDFVVPLRIAPPSLENLLMRGKWLCISMSVWNSHDIQAGCRAVERIKERQGEVNLGLRPFDYPEENYTWIPRSRIEQPVQLTEVLAKQQSGSLELAINGVTNTSPVWMGVSDGTLVDVRYGQLSNVEIDEFIAEIIGAYGEHVQSASHS